jgi:MFS family permease
MTDESQDPLTWRELLQTGMLWQFAFLCLGIWLHAADELIIATMAPAIVADIGGLELVGWAFALYEIGAITAGVSAGWLVARSSLKTVMIAAAFTYMIGCIISALATTMPILLAGRILQGLGGGGLIAVAFVATESLFPRRAWPKLFAIMSVVWGSSAFGGPLIGGLFATYGLWRWSFWAFAIQAAFLILAVSLIIRMPRKSASVDGKRMPIVRLLVLTASIVLIAAAGIDVDPVTSPLCLTAGVVMLYFFLKRDSASQGNRLLPARPFAWSTRLGAGLTMVFLMTLSTIPFSVYAATLLGKLHGISPLMAGYIIALESIAWSTLGLLVASAQKRYEALLVRLGMSLVLLGSIIAMFTMARGPIPLLLLCPILMGAGFGMSWPFIVGFIVEEAPPQDRSIASAAVPALQRAGYAIGAALAGIVANWSGFSNGLTEAAALSVAFWIFAAFIPPAALGVVAAFRMTAR